MEIMLFGRLAEFAGKSVIEDDVADTDRLLKSLKEKYPALANSKFMIAVDKNVVTTNTVLNQHSEVALLPPYSGG